MLRAAYPYHAARVQSADMLQETQFRGHGCMDRLCIKFRTILRVVPPKKLANRLLPVLCEYGSIRYLRAMRLPIRYPSPHDSARESSLVVLGFQSSSYICATK